MQPLKRIRRNRQNFDAGANDGDQPPNQNEGDEPWQDDEDADRRAGGAAGIC